MKEGIKMNTKVIPLHSAIGRNDPCYCGSGKKYKKCCLSKDEERKIRQSESNTEMLSDKYFGVKEYIDEVGYPLSRFDFFLFELLNIAGGVLYRYGKTNKEDEKEILKSLIKDTKKFISMCKDCKYQCLSNPMKQISFKSLMDKGLRLEEFPPKLQKPIAINFFYFEFVNIFTSCFSNELDKYILPSEGEEIVSELHATIFDYISDNCWGTCDNSCIKDHQKNAYCKFCCFGKSKLPCPQKGEISFEEIGAKESDMEH